MALERYQDPDLPRLFSLKAVGLEYHDPSRLLRENHSGTNIFLNLRHPGAVWVVFVDGACPDNGKPWARGGYGVYFGPDSRYNVSKPLRDNGIRHTSQRAELTAALVALHQIESLVSKNDYDVWRGPWVIATDSAYVVNALTLWMYKWRRNDYTASSGWEVVNRDLLERLDDKLDVMANGRQGIDVLLWKVDRSENEEADALARRGATM